MRLAWDIDAAAEAVQEASAAALEGWPVVGILAFPRAWIMQMALQTATTSVADAPPRVGHGS
jgi:predicted RNA polymerase sigma factor